MILLKVHPIFPDLFGGLVYEFFHVNTEGAWMGGQSESQTLSQDHRSSHLKHPHPQPFSLAGRRGSVPLPRGRG
jgi:hypothetical protein